MNLLLPLFSIIQVFVSSHNIVENEIFGQPLVKCGNEFIQFSVKTTKPFRGKVFVKGQHGNSNCSRNYSGTDSTDTFHSKETADSSPQNGNDSLEATTDYRSTTATAQPSHSSSLNRFTFNANDHEYGRSSSSIFATVATTPYHHCPPCPVCQHAMNGHQQQKTIENTVNLRIRLGTCNINYEQQVKPRSTIISLTVVVSFHQNLLTKLDRAFRIQCAYTEGSKTIDANLNVSMPPSIEVKSTMNSPHCIYTVKSPSGKVITHARIGELVDHQWICRSLFKGVYAMLVRNCFAESNDNFRVRVIDENGCTLDPYILPNLQYASDLMSAKVRVPVFKFPDHSEISFRCDVLVCMQGKHDCELITPPKCTSDKRKRRNLLNTSRESLILQTLTMNIVDLDYVTPGLESDPLILNPSLHSKPLQYCLTVTRFACFIASATFLITTTATLIGAFIISFNSHHINIFSASDL